MKDPRIHTFSWTTQFRSCKFCLNRFHFLELSFSSCWSLRISNISVKVSEVIWKKIFNPIASFIQLIFSQLSAFKILFFVQLPLQFSLHTRSNKNIRLHDGQFRKYRTCTDCDYIKGISRGNYCSVARTEKNLGGHRFTDALDMVKVVASCLIIVEKKHIYACHTESKSFRTTFLRMSD